MKHKFYKFVENWKFLKKCSKLFLLIPIILLFSIYSFIFINNTPILEIDKSKCKIFENYTFNSYYFENTYQQPTLFCLIVASPDSLKNRAIDIHNAWASKCTKHLFVTVINSSVTQSAIEIIVNGIPVLQPINFTYDHYNMLTQKMFHSLIHLYKWHNNYDWYLKADLDTFVFVTNLKNFLSDKNSKSPVTYGYDFKVLVDQGYHSGGAGYVWSNEAMKRLGSKLAINYSFCNDTGNEDVDVALCLRKVGVYPKPSLDTNGRERFHVLRIDSHLIGPINDWLHDWSLNNVTVGFGCCSETSISFHREPHENIVKLGKLVNSFEYKKKSINVLYIIKELFNC